MSLLSTDPHASSKATASFQILDQDFFLATGTAPQIPKFQKLNDYTGLSRRQQQGIDDILKCTLCSKAFDDPVTDPCGHTFCAKCIAGARKINNICPMTLERYDTKEEFAVDLMIDALLKANLPCQNQGLGCDWYGSNRQEQNHVKKECDYGYFECPNKDCKNVLSKMDIASHLQECKYNTIRCKDCRWSGFSYQRIQHDEKCFEKVIACPFFCGESIKRKDLRIHSKKCSNKTLALFFQEKNMMFADPKHKGLAEKSSIENFQISANLTETQQAQQEVSVSQMRDKLKRVPKVRKTAHEAPRKEKSHKDLEQKKEICLKDIQSEWDIMLSKDVKKKGLNCDTKKQEAWDKLIFSEAAECVMDESDTKPWRKIFNLRKGGFGRDGMS